MRGRMWRLRIDADGTVSCQFLPRGVASVSALAALPRMASTVSEPGNVRGGIGRFQSAGEDDIGIARIDQHAPDAAGLLQAHQGPGLTGVQRLIDAGPDGNVAARPPERPWH